MDSVVYVLFLALVSLPWMCSSVSCETLRDFESHTYPYSGAPEIFISPENGTYRVELWGASANGGPGAYVRGDISLAAGEKLYVYVGGTGIVSMNDPDIVVFNGGGRAGLIMGDSAPGGIGFSTGAGATDMRLRGGAWDDQSSLLSRIMVAAGSGGSWGVKGHAGGLTGYDAPSSRYQASYVTYGGNGGSQTSGGAATSFDLCTKNDGGVSRGEEGRFGAGGQGGAGMSHRVYYYGGYGGGGGYYGGSGSSGGGYMSGRDTAGGGGSSYISGHAGCVAVSPANGGETHRPDVSISIHHSGKYFANTLMIDGAGYTWTHLRGEKTKTPNPSGGTYAHDLGHMGDGFARITRISAPEFLQASHFGPGEGDS